jgi:hypothetical protein
VYGGGGGDGGAGAGVVCLLKGSEGWHEGCARRIEVVKATAETRNQRLQPKSKARDGRVNVHRL